MRWFHRNTTINHVNSIEYVILVFYYRKYGAIVVFIFNVFWLKINKHVKTIIISIPPSRWLIVVFTRSAMVMCCGGDSVAICFDQWIGRH